MLQQPSTCTAALQFSRAQTLSSCNLLLLLLLQGGGLLAADRRASLLPSQGAGAATGGSTLPTLSTATVWNLVDALWDQMSGVLGDISGLADQLADEGSVELRGRLGNAHLAAVLAAAVKR